MRWGGKTEPFMSGLPLFSNSLFEDGGCVRNGPGPVW